MTNTRSLLLIAAALAGTACSNASRDAQASVVDSVIPREEALRRFRVGLNSTDTLYGGASSRDQLVRRFVAALEARDTASLTALALTRDEFAFIYYPTDPQSLPPYDLSPQLMWFMLNEHSGSGLAHALEERGGHPLHVVGDTCEGAPSHQGPNTVWGPCYIRRVQAPGDTVSERLFGPIIERGGRFKFVSYANKL